MGGKCLKCYDAHPAALYKRVLDASVCQAMQVYSLELVLASTKYNSRNLKNLRLRKITQYRCTNRILSNVMYANVTMIFHFDVKLRKKNCTHKFCIHRRFLYMCMSQT